MTKRIIVMMFINLFIALLLFACKSNDVTPASTTQVPDVYKKIYGASSITSDGTYITIKTSGAPDHKSVYYATANSLYENFTGTTFGGNAFKKNPNSISTFNYTFKIPLNPKVAATHAATPLGAIGVSLNGVPFYNQYAGPNQPLTNEITSFDQFYGHPQQAGAYHYHVEPIYLTQVKATKSALLGFLLDGFPVYGPQENGADVAESSLDAYHGHAAATADYPDGIYHYHITNKDPYINGSGYYGTPAQFRNSKAFGVVLLLALFGCKPSEPEVNLASVRIDKNGSNLSIENGLLLWNHLPLTGTLFSLHENKSDTMSLSPYRNGKEHGEWKRFYEGGKLKEQRFFRSGQKEGEYLAWWPDGKKQLHYLFENGEYEGMCREWNDQGTLTKLASYKKGHEEGLQQLWYDNGKIRANYVIKEGRRFGLLGTKNCINVSDSIFRK